MLDCDVIAQIGKQSLGRIGLVLWLQICAINYYLFIDILFKKRNRLLWAVRLRRTREEANPIMGTEHMTLLWICRVPYVKYSGEMTSNWNYLES